MRFDVSILKMTVTHLQGVIFPIHQFTRAYAVQNPCEVDSLETKGNGTQISKGAAHAISDDNDLSKKKIVTHTQ